MRDELTGSSTAGAGQKTACPRDFVLWGASHAEAFAERYLAQSRADRRRSRKIELRRVKDLARQFQHDGASSDEAALYVGTFEQVLSAIESNPNGSFELTVKT